MPKPFFSVVLPTKNRSFLLGAAISSLLNQKFPDWELIIADNDDTDATAKAVDAFKDSRIRRVRSGNLSMPDNWEFGCSQATGEHLTIIEDKQVLKSYALLELHKLIERERPESIKWIVDEFDEADGVPRVHRAKGSREIRAIPSEDLLRDFTQNLKRDYKGCIPLGYRSCITRALAERIRSGPVGRLCPPNSPDFTLGYLQLAYADVIWHVDEALTLFTSTVHSNGRSLATNGATFRRYSQELGGDARFFDEVPVKAVSIQGAIYNDYARLSRIVSGRLAKFPINPTNYFIQVHQSIQELKRAGRDITDALKAWETALGAQRLEVQSRVRELTNVRDRERGLVHELSRSIGLKRLERSAKRFYRGTIKDDPQWKFQTPADYLAWDESQRKLSAPPSSSDR
ncbi:MAG TPA: glycosyltransferase [Methylomirabilota bacterium]|nr:glycosyltransferase [Methylomirabilota bacterium]